MHRLLRDGYHFSEWTDIDFVKRVSGAEVGWTLGWMLEATNSLPEVVVAGGDGNILLIIATLLLFSSLGPVIYCCCKFVSPKRRGGLSRRSDVTVDLSRYHYIEDFRPKSG